MKMYRAMSFEEFEKYLSGETIVGKASPYAYSTASGVCFINADTTIFPIQRDLTFCKEDLEQIVSCMEKDNECGLSRRVSPTEVRECFSENQMSYDIMVEFDVKSSDIKEGYGIYSNNFQSLLEYEEYMVSTYVHRILMTESDMPEYSIENAKALKFTCFDTLPLNDGGETEIWFSVEEYRDYMNDGIDGVYEGFIWDNKTSSLVEYDYYTDIDCPIHGDYSVFDYYGDDPYGDFADDALEVSSAYFGEYDEYDEYEEDCDEIEV